MSAYPKALYLGGWHNLASYRAVASAAEEEEARAEGFKTLPEWPHPDTFGEVSPAPVVNPMPAAVVDTGEAHEAPPKPDRMAKARAARAAKRAG